MNSLVDPPSDRVQRLRPWLDRPLAARQCVLGWLIAAAAFLGLMAPLGGPTTNDAGESFYQTWAIAHAKFACSYPPPTKIGFYPIFTALPPVPPLWPLLSGGLSALLRIGHEVPFPSQSALGHNCSTAYYAMYEWAGAVRVTLPTVGLGYLSWFVLGASVVALLRTTRRGRTGWEPATLLLLACSPPILMPILDEFHPQDLVALGLSFGALACARRGRWIWVGVLLGLAFTSQQFALLILAPLLVLAPANRRVKLAAAAAATAALVAVPVIAVTHGRAFRAVVLGTGNTPSYGGTVLWQLHLHGLILVALSRVLPIILSMALAGWVVRRLGQSSLEPVPLIALMALSLSLRLVFEQNIFGYYYMALTVCLLVLYVLRGRIRGELLAWIAMITLAYNPVPAGFTVNSIRGGSQIVAGVRMSFVAIALLLIVLDAVHGRVRWYRVVFFALAAAAFINWPPWQDIPFRHQFPVWFWQLVLVPTGLALAAGPLISYVRDRAKIEDAPALLPESVT